MDNSYPKSLSSSPSGPLRWYARLHWQLGCVCLAVMLVGSVACVLWMGHRARVEEAQKFHGEALTMANFLSTAKIPLTQRTAENLSEALGVDVYFQLDGRWVPRVPAGQESTLEAGALLTSDSPGRQVGDGKLLTVVEMDAGSYLLLQRRVAAPVSGRIEPSTLGLIALLWAVVVGATWFLYRAIVAPVRSLSHALPGVLESPECVPLEAQRSDEIGLLARTFVETGQQLQQERELRRESEHLAMLGKIATGLAHEIRNPVAAIRMHAQLLQRDSASHSAEAEGLGIIASQADRIEGLVNQWMFLAKPEPPVSKAVDLAALAKQEAGALEPMAAHAGVGLVLAGASQALVSGDGVRLGQVIGNILRNAIQASSPGSSVQVESFQEAGRAGVEVRDAGEGFTPDALQHASELFFSEKEGGMGIGLSLARLVVVGHQGQVQLANGKGGGAVVRIELPTRDGQTGEQA